MNTEVSDILDKITVNEQSSIRVGTEKTLYFDPFRIKDAPHDADVIFITHPHYDHFSPEDIEKVVKKDTLFIIPSSMRDEITKVCRNRARIIEFEPGDIRSAGDITVEAIPAYNVNKAFHPKKNGWLGYIVTVCGVRIYAAGDTDATDEAKRVKCDVALLPIGGTYTMTAKEARELAKSLSPAAAIPIHYGSVVGSRSDYDVFAKGLDIAVKKL